MKAATATFAILIGILTCALAAVGTLSFIHWVDARPEFVAATQPGLSLTTLGLVGVAAIRMARRRTD